MLNLLLVLLSTKKTNKSAGQELLQMLLTNTFGSVVLNASHDAHRAKIQQSL